MGILKKINLAKIIIRQGDELVKKDKLIKKLKEENASNREEIITLELYKNNQENLKDEVIRKLLELQKINRYGLKEDDKNKRRNMYINEIIKELSSTRKSTR